MTINLIRYLLETTLVWAALLIFYRAVLQGSDRWRLRRAYLLVSFLLGVTMPLLPSIHLHASAAARLPARLIDYMVPAASAAAQPSAAAAPALSYGQLALLVWLGVAALILGMSLYRLARHLRPAAGHGETFAGFRVVRSPTVNSPYAALGRIYLPLSLPPELERTALLHEAAHLRHGHFRERMLLLVGTALCWFHPLAWVYARLLAEVHEYEADAAVVREVPAKTYGRQLLHATLAPRPVLGLFSSPIKKRITMLTDSLPTHRLRPRHGTLLLLLLTALLFACTGEDLGEELVPNSAARDFSLPALQNDDTAPVPLNDEFPTFLHGFYSQVRYPSVAREARATGTVSVAARLTRDGEVESVSVTPAGAEGTPGNEALVVIGYSDTPGDYTVPATADHGLREEVERAFRAIGPFRPATSEGQPVPALLKFDVRFGIE
ncbi:M56 family metallopeptidase [Lewinella sp. IMCC34183]|uniref:M56 family metallopeptidase n=1 Tax=Lewinella sp. IMCC34183 TaxID=2248762 RepID=UPI000E24FAC0|nr:M56 family metallopeptidase [Lewinella sp. IMCC34183]